MQPLFETLLMAFLWGFTLAIPAYTYYLMEIKPKPHTRATKFLARYRDGDVTYIDGEYATMIIWVSEQ